MPKHSEYKELVHPFKDPKVLNRLMNLETLYLKRETTSEVIGELCSIYSDLVQYYDLKQDPIHAYFLERIQIISLTQSAKSVLLKARSLESADEELSKPS